MIIVENFSRCGKNEKAEVEKQCGRVREKRVTKEQYNDYENARFWRGDNDDFFPFW